MPVWVGLGIKQMSVFFFIEEHHALPAGNCMVDVVLFTHLPSLIPNPFGPFCIWAFLCIYIFTLSYLFYSVIRQKLNTCVNLSLLCRWISILWWSADKFIDCLYSYNLIFIIIQYLHYYYYERCYIMYLILLCLFKT